VSHIPGQSDLIEERNRIRRRAGLAPLPEVEETNRAAATVAPAAPDPIRPLNRWQQLWPWAVAFLLALGLRLAYVQQIRAVPFFSTPVGDAAAYDAWARRIAGGDWIGHEAFYQAPAYPYFLAIVYRFLDDSPWGIRWVQAVLGAISCLLVGWAAARFFACAPQRHARAQAEPRSGAASGPGQKVLTSRSGTKDQPPVRGEAPQAARTSGRAPAAALAAQPGMARAIGITAAVLLAIYPPAIFFGGLIQKTALATFWMALVLYLASVQLDRPRGWVFLIMGVVLGMFGLTRENALVLAGVIFLWIFAGFRGAGWRARRMWATYLVAGLLLVFYPVTLRNWFVAGEWVITTVQAGPNFYIGNRPGATGRYAPLQPGHETPEFERADAKRLAEQATGRPLSGLEVSHYWFSQAWAYIRNQPRDWLRLMGAKTLLALNRYEITDTEGYNVYRAYAWMLDPPARILHFGTLMPLAAAGALFTLRFWRRLGVLYAISLALLLAIVLFYIFARYRFPLAPPAILFAAAGLVELVRRIRARRFASVAVACAVMIPVAVACNRQVSPEAELDALAFANLGTTLAMRGDVAAAVPFLQMAIDRSPDSPGPYYNIGRAYLLQENTQMAIQNLLEAKRRAPNLAGVDLHLGLACELEGNRARALEFYRQALAADPTDAEAAAAIERLQQ